MASLMILRPFPFTGLAPSTSAFVLGVLSAVYLAWKWALPKPLKGIPYNKAALDSVFGDTVEIAEIKKTGGPLRNWFAQQPLRHRSPIVQVFTRPLGRPTVIISDFREVQDILVRRNKEFDKGGPMIEAFRGVVRYHHVCMETSEPQFKINRDLIKDLMTPSFLTDVSVPEIHLHALKLIDLWRFKAEIADGRPIEAGRDLQMMTFDMTRDLSLGSGRGQGFISRHFDAVKSKGSIGLQPQSAGDKDIVIFPPHEEGEDMMTQETIQAAIAASMPKPLPALFHVLNNRSPHMRRAYAEKDKLIMHSIQKAIQNIKEHRQDRSAVDYIVRREMISAKKAGRSPDYYSQPLQEELYGYLTAGYETTAAAMQWGIKYLAAHQDVQTRLRQTLIDALPEAKSEGRQPTVLELIKTPLPYLDAVVEEILRLATPIRSIFRVAKMDTTVLGQYVPKGTQMILMTYGPDISMPGFSVNESLRGSGSQSYKDNIKSWKGGDEHLFRPDRWLKVDEGSERFDAQAGPTLAFSAGVRGCFGKRLAYMELRLLVSLLLWNIMFLPLSENENVFDPADGLGIKPKKCLAKVAMTT